MDEVRFDMTYEGSAGTHEGSGEPHEGSGVFDRCCKKVKNYFLDGSTHLYMRSCPSVGRSVGRSVRRSVRRSVTLS